MVPYNISVYVEDDGNGNKNTDCGNLLAEESSMGPYFILCCLKHREEYIRDGIFELT